MDEEAVEEGAVLKIAAVALGLASLLPVVEADIDDETMGVMVTPPGVLAFASKF